MLALPDEVTTSGIVVDSNDSFTLELSKRIGRGCAFTERGIVTVRQRSHQGG